MANKFATFFKDKIVNIRARLDNNSQIDDTLPVVFYSATPPMWDEFELTNNEEVRKIMMNSKATTCQLDPLPTSFLKLIIDVILPVLTKIINLSFEEGTFPDELKLALILPLLKKLGLDPELFNNFRPVSNLACLPIQITQKSCCLST